MNPPCDVCFGFPLKYSAALADIKEKECFADPGPTFNDKFCHKDTKAQRVFIRN